MVFEYCDHTVLNELEAHPRGYVDIFHLFILSILTVLVHMTVAIIIWIVIPGIL